MKLLIVTCIREHESLVKQIFKQAGISVFSIIPSRGIKNDPDLNLLDDWFGNSDGEADSLVLFSFSESESVKNCINLIDNSNTQSKSNFPIRAFALPVETFSNQIL